MPDNAGLPLVAKEKFVTYQGMLEVALQQNKTGNNEYTDGKLGLKLAWKCPHKPEFNTGYLLSVSTDTQTRACLPLFSDISYIYYLTLELTLALAFPLEPRALMHLK